MTAPDTVPVDSDSLPPTQYLILEVLAARYRTGESYWTLPSRFTNQLRILAEAGLVGFEGAGEKTLRAWLTDDGKAAAMSDGYQAPADREIVAERDMWRDACQEARAAFSELMDQHVQLRAAVTEMSRRQEEAP